MRSGRSVIVASGVLGLAVVLAVWLGVRSSTERPTRDPAGEPDAAACPARLVILSPALAVTIRDMGLADLAVGRHGWDAVLPERLPICGDQSAIDYEALIRARPTHVLHEWGSRAVPPRLERLAAERGWAVRGFTLLSLDQVRGSIDELGDLLAGAVPDAPERAAALGAEFDRAMSDVDAGRARAGTVLLLVGVAPAAALGPGSSHHEILVRLGAAPAITDGRPYAELDHEDVLRLAPGAIVLISPGPAAGPAPREPLDWDAVRARVGSLADLDVPAMARRRVAIIEQPLALMPGSSLIAFADELAKALDDWAQDP